MRSPFSDSYEVQPAPFPVPKSEVEINSPLTDNYDFNQEFWQETTNNSDLYMRETESELSGRALESAVELNEKYKTLYRWGGFIPLILPQIGVNPNDTVKIMSDPKEFSKAFAKWQASNGISGSNLGVLGINSWTFLQKKLKFHNLSNKYGIHVAKAITANKVYEARLWKDRMNDIYSWLSSAKILPMALPVNDEHFGYAIADFQKSKGLTIDGILGPGTFDILKNTKVTPPAPTPAKLTPSKWHSILPNAVQSPTETFVNGNDAFRKMVEIIKTATQKDHFIYLLSGWVVDIDFCLLPNSASNLIDTSSTLRSLLTIAGKSGVEIKIISWNNPETLGDISKAETFINELRTKDNANAFLIRDNLTYGTEMMKAIMSQARDKMDLLNPFLSQIDTWNDWYSKAKAFPNEGSHHEKILVVKGSKGLFAFCGGMDLHSNRIMGLKGFCCRNYSNPAHNCDLDDSGGKYNRYSRILHDVHSLVEGKAAISLLQRFINRWNLHRVQFGGASAPLSLPALPNAGPVSPSTPFVKVLHTFNHHKDITKKDRSILHTVKLAIERASNSVFLEDQYMISPEIASFLNKAVRANPKLQVRIHTQDDALAGADLMFPQKFRGRFRRFLFNGLDASQKSRIQVMILDPTSVAPVRRRVHSKTYIIDDELAIIGSANCNRRSMTFDSETAVALFQNGDPAQGSVVSKLKEDLQKDPFNKWISYKENLTGAGVDLDVRIRMNPYYNVAAALLAVSGPAFSFGLDRMVAMISALLIKAIDPYPDGEPDLIVKEIEEEAVEIGYENELLEMEVTTGADGEFTSYEDFPQAESTIADPEYELEPETIEGENYSESEDLFALPAKPCMCHNKKSNYEMQDEVLAEIIEQQVRAVSKGATSNCEGRNCWAKTVLNKLGGLNLSLNNTIDEPTKRALEDFQQRNNLPLSQKLDFATERALLEADAIQKHKGAATENATVSVIATAKTKIEDWTSKGAAGVKNKPQHILNSFRDPRKVWAFVLHQMAFKRPKPRTKVYSDPESYLNTGAHFCIMFDGRIIQLHPFSRMIWHGNCLSPRSVAVEFEGNFPNIKGKWWVNKKSKVQNTDIPTQAQFEAGRFLASYLKVVLGTTHIFAHRQSSDSRENDPGPDIWYNVGQWAIDNLGMTDGGPSSKCGTGNPILPEWRSWANKTNSLIKKEFDDIDQELEDLAEAEEWEDYHSESLHPDPMMEEENPEREEDFFFRQ